jgi:hypothetical protein
MAGNARKNSPPGNGFLGWLGRQIGYVKHAVKADVTKGKEAKSATPPPSAPMPEPPQVVHREARVEEARLPDQPNLTFRRTTIDEVIVEEAADPNPGPHPEP